MRKTFWERRCENDIVRKTLWKRCDKTNLKKDVVRKTLWMWEKHCRLRRCERCCVNYIVRKTMWERHCEKDVMRKTLWERRYEEDVVRKTLRERHRFIFDGASPSINSLIHMYISLGNVEFGPLLKPSFFILDILCMQISSLFPRKISISTDHSALTNCWSPRGIQGHWPSSFL